MFYFDNAATTRVYPEVAMHALKLMQEEYGNPSSQHKLGKNALQELNAARASVRRAINADSGALIFTSCGSESNNQAILSATYANRRVGKHIITSAVEHPSVLECIKGLEAGGFEVTCIKPDKNGVVRAEDVAAALRPDTALVSIMLVNNETGAVNPISAIRDAISSADSKALLHCDCVQGLFKVPVDVNALGVDYLTLSAHKIHAPKGVGALYIRQGLGVIPVIKGGGQENGARSGTENMASIGAFGLAAHIGYTKLSENALKLVELRKYFEQRLAESGVGAHINFTGGVPHIISLCIDGCRSEVVTRILSDRDICVSAGSACAKGRRSYVLEACGLPVSAIDCTIRISLSDLNTEDDIDELIDGISAAYARFHRK